jgi:UrcA family protein
MRRLFQLIGSPVLVGALAAAGMAAGSFAWAQSSPPPMPVPPTGSVFDTDAYAAPVDYRDLDLRTEAGRRELRRRVEVAAIATCKELGKPDATERPQTSCRYLAVTDALKQVRALETRARLADLPHPGAH